MRAGLSCWAPVWCTRKVLAGCDIDPEIYSGFAFGIGLERMAMRRFKISDMRMIFENDIRFLSQF